jgi:geranylgeranyl transferase type-1 subunit beta
MAAVSLMGKSPEKVINQELLLHWLISRATTEFELDESDEEDETPAKSSEQSASGSIIAPTMEYDCLGFNGRCNKVADTCYAWWTGATLQVMIIVVSASITEK